jgi:ligand-binding SRPBCC domain-containing protein
MPRIEITTEVAAPLERVFDLARDIDVHQQSQTKHQERAVAGRTSGLIEEGEEVTWEAVHFGVRQKLTSRITVMRRPAHFRDVMVRGAFKRFEHDHYFTSLPGNRTLMRDVFDYTSPLGWLGRLADILFLQRYMARLLLERNLVIKRLAET